MEMHKYKAEKNQEKREAVIRNFSLKNKEINDQGYKAYNQGLKDSENRVKANFDLDQTFSASQYKMFKQYD
jgi:hypothetical protein